MQTKLSIIRKTAAVIQAQQTPEQRAAPSFGDFLRLIGITVDEWESYRAAKRAQLRRKARTNDEVHACNPSGWESLAWVRLGKPDII